MGLLCDNPKGQRCKGIAVQKLESVQVLEGRRARWRLCRALKEGGYMGNASGGAKGKSAADLSSARVSICVVLLVVMGFILGSSEFIIIGIEQQVADAFAVPLSSVGGLVSIFALAYAILTPVLALTTGRFRRYTLLIIYSLLFCAGNALAAISPTFEMLYAARVVLGAVSGGLLAVGVTYLPELLGPKRTSFGISLVYGAFSVAMVISTSLGKMIAEVSSWRVAMWAVLAVSIAVCVALVAMLPRAGETDEPATVRDQIGLLGEPQVLVGMAIFIFGVGGVYVLYAFITPYLEQVLGMSALQASGTLMVYGVMCIISNMLSGIVDARVGMKGLVPVFLLQAGLLFALYLLGAAMPAALLVILGLGISMYVLSVPCISMFMRVARQRHPKAMMLASSVEPTAFNIGISFGTAVGSAVVAGPGMANAGVVGAVFSLVACALTLLTMRIDRRRG